MTDYIVVRNWEKFQHYSDRTAPWIKVYTELAHDEKWLQLPAGRRGMLVSLWLEYDLSRYRLPADTRQLSRRLHTRLRQDDLQALVDAGFIEISASPPHQRAASPRARATEQRREEERRTEQNGLPDFQTTSETTLEIQRLLREIGTGGDKNTVNVLSDLATKGATPQHFSQARDALFNSDPDNRAGFAVRTIKNLMDTTPAPQPTDQEKLDAERARLKKAREGATP